MFDLKNKTITNAFLTFTSIQNTNSSIKLGILAENVGDCLTFSPTYNNIGSRTLTSKSVTWIPTQWTINSRVKSPNIAPVLNEVVQRPDFSSNSLCLILLNFGSANYTERLVSGVEDTARQPTSLTVTYY